MNTYIIKNLTSIPIVAIISGYNGILFDGFIQKQEKIKVQDPKLTITIGGHNYTLEGSRISDATTTYAWDGSLIIYVSRSLMSTSVTIWAILFVVIILVIIFLIILAFIPERNYLESC
jgi:hypothetical protein